MTDNFTNNPAAYLSELQRIEREQELAKLRTLSLEFAGVLDFFPKLREELEAFHHADGLAFHGLTDRLRPTLKQAVDLWFEIEHLPSDARNAPEMQAVVHQASKIMRLQSVELFALQYQGVTQAVQLRLEAEHQARKQREREQAEAACRAEGKREKERRELEAKIKAAMPEMVVIPAGSFIMGCVSGNWLGLGNRDNVGKARGHWDAEQPAHAVTLASFAIGKYPVTFAQFDAFYEATRYESRPHKRPLPDDNGWGRGNRPVINISWELAQDYIYWLRAVTGKAFRLPSEAEWEYAARGGDYRYAYPWGQKADPRRANYGNNVGKTTPVGQYPANGFSLYDMHGNVWEWCQDTWHHNYQGAPTDGTAWVSDDSFGRIMRGGSWCHLPSALRSAYHDYFPPLSYGSRDIGFRLVLDQC